MFGGSTTSDRQIVEQSNPLNMYDQSNKIKCNG